MIVISICLSDIPQEARRKANNGKVYANFCIDERKEPDRYDNTHTVWIQQTKEEREAKTPKVYVGNGKEYKFDNQQNKPSQQYQPPIQNDDNDDDSLPF